MPNQSTESVPGIQQTLDSLSVPLAIGTLQWGTTLIDQSLINPNGVISETDAKAIVDILSNGGVTVWDTAEGYGGGTSEKRLGRLLPPKKEVMVMTKFLPAPWRSHHSSFESAVRGSCQRLGVETIAIYLLHSPVHWRPIEYWVESAAICKQKGLLQSMGLSNCNAERLLRATSLASTLSSTKSISHSWTTTALPCKKCKESVKNSVSKWWAFHQLGRDS